MKVKKRSYLFLASITFLLLTFASCRSAKYLEDNQYLVTQVDINGISPKLKENAEMYVANEIRPNSPLYLTFYNLFNTKKGRYKTDNIKKVGEEPRILDSAMVDLSATQIERFLQTKGYFNAQVNSQVELKKKKAKVNFNITPGQAYHLNDIQREFDDSQVESIYLKEVLPKNLIKKGEQYNTSNLFAERELLHNKMREAGYYDYLRQYMRVGLDTIGLENKANVTIQVTSPDSLGQHQVYHIDQLFINVQTEDDQLSKPAKQLIDTLRRITYTDYSGKFRLRPIARYAFLRSQDKYNVRNEELSYDRLYEMNGFRSVKINYVKKDSAKLDVYYNLVPRPTMSNQMEGEYTFSSGMSGFNLGNTFSHRNVFGGSETIEVKMRYGVLFDSRLPGNLTDKIFNTDFQIGVNLSFPTLLTPFRVRSVGRYGLPKTTFSSSLQLFFQDQTYANRYFINSVNYLWFQATNKMHSFTPIVIEYRDGRLNNEFKDNLIDQGYELYVRSNNRRYFGLGSQYAFTYNSPKLTTLSNFNYFRGALDVSGNLLSVLSNLMDFKKDEDNSRLIFGVPYLQYIKGELDYRLYKHWGGHKQFVFRVNAGMAVPYGNNSSLLIFEKSFFAGGMNGIRAWQARTLGPGAYNRENTDEAVRLNLRNLDQLGELKLESNLEYRFRLLNNFFGAKLNGATFLDAGNVWRLRKDNLNPDGEFNGEKFLSQIALGTGFGLRVDLDYFIIRLDAGLKLKDPQFTGSNQWVIKHFFNSRDFKDNYYQAHRPDRYNFIQYNFGVGMPF